MIVLRTNFKRIFRKPINIIVMLIIPILLNLIVITLANKPENYDVVFVMEENTDITQKIMEQFGQLFSLQSEDDIGDAKQLVNDGYADYIIEIENNFTDELLKGNAYVKTYSREGDESIKPVSTYVVSYFESLNRLGHASDNDKGRFMELLDQFHSGIVDIEYKYSNNISRAKVDNAINSLGYVAVGMVYFITFATMLLFEDKKYGVYGRVSGTPMGRMSYFFQHLMSYLFFAAIQSMIMIGVMPQIVDVWYGNGFIQKAKLFLVCMVFASVCISIGIAVSTFSRNIIMANSIISMINVPMLMLGGCFWPASFMPDEIQRIGKFMPTTWFLNAARGVLRNEEISKYIIYIVTSMSLSIILMILASFATKNKVDSIVALERDRRKSEQ